MLKKDAKNFLNISYSIDQYGKTRYYGALYMETDGVLFLIKYCLFIYLANELLWLGDIMVMFTL